MKIARVRPQGEGAMHTVEHALTEDEQIFDDNAACLQREIDWFSQALEIRLQQYFTSSAASSIFTSLPPPDLHLDNALYAQWAHKNKLNQDERLLLILALLPHIQPQILDTFFIHNAQCERQFTEFGGRKGQVHSGFLPTGETAMFIIAGNDLNKRLQLLSLFDSGHVFSQEQVLVFRSSSSDEPLLTCLLTVSCEFINRILRNRHDLLDYSSTFPAKRITSDLEWEDLVLPPEVVDDIEHIRMWIKHGEHILSQWSVGKSLKPGYRSLFYGPPGTGKTLTATLIGSELNMAVYRVDLSSLISKYIGETEKNLAHLFDQAETKNWILFFDEADALFSTRTQSSSANDRHSNQQIAYLLQRIEDFPGVVILASNLRANIDPAFSRRFQSLIYFPMPNATLRLQLWLQILSGHYADEEQDKLIELAEKYEISGGAITNVVRFAAMSALQSEREIIEHQDLIKGVMKELRKEGRTI
ncbi:ATP-binding protein [Shewanella surugensis]|uniref:ATP-binding protein n=1 Tax=Shewanella surugensis TaxID=212020 RepID=A0ABT0L7R3_9GAMM|nr:ATP-binding protein [Shewanella surugensis]MCL1123737.1 ATP-binding protein [Shewanella surugensis]